MDVQIIVIKILKLELCGMTMILILDWPIKKPIISNKDKKIFLLMSLKNSKYKKIKKIYLMKITTILKIKFFLIFYI
jgi:hypothetical protein